MSAVFAVLSAAVYVILMVIGIQRWWPGLVHDLSRLRGRKAVRHQACIRKITELERWHTQWEQSWILEQHADEAGHRDL
jgi:hypothetical protein